MPSFTTKHTGARLNSGSYREFRENMEPFRIYFRLASMADISSMVASTVWAFSYTGVSTIFPW
jgi:hypothetical protein